MNLTEIKAWIQLYIGFFLFWLSGGYLLVLLGLLPGGVLAAVLGLLTAGTLTAVDIVFLSALGAIWVAIGIPTAIYGAALMDVSVQKLFKKSFGISKRLKIGVAKIPIVSQLTGIVLS